MRYTMSRLRQSDDGWDIAGSVGATAVMFAAGRAAETAQVATSTDDRLEDDAVESVLAHCFQLRETAHSYSTAGRAVSRG